MDQAKSPQSPDPLVVLKDYWGYEQFRPPQLEIISSLLNQQDSLVLLPTGAGKSICFQLPALMQAGMTIVVSPLVSLMENQVQELRDRHINAALLHSQQSASARKQALESMEMSRLTLLYLSPETLLSQPIWAQLQSLGPRLKMLIIDEAHCLVQWGTTFRPVYRRLGAVRNALKSNDHRITIGAFTATADPNTRKEIRSALGLHQPNTVCLSPYRANLDLQVAIAWTPKGRRTRLLRLIEQQGMASGLVYTRSRRDSEELATWLCTQGYRTKAYHAGLAANERRTIEQAWLTDTLQFVVCTCAFGMGVNKPNVRWIAHFQAPLTLNEYIQEVGRAGRDGQRSHGLMLVSEPTGWLDPQDQQQRQYFLTQLHAQCRQAQALVKRLPRESDIASVVRAYPQAEMSLSLLHSMRQLQWIDPMHYKIISPRSSIPIAVNDQPIRQMSEFIRTQDCRWQFILRCFGFPNELEQHRCGHCDRCLSKSKLA
jgi:ATP-dependent DNA helicase RecQ